MPELPMRKRLSVVRLYFESVSYEDIARRAGVAKGTVVNVINELKAGQFPQIRNPEDGMETWRRPFRRSSSRYRRCFQERYWCSGDILSRPQTERLLAC